MLSTLPNVPHVAPCHMPGCVVLCAWPAHICDDRRGEFKARAFATHDITVKWWLTKQSLSKAVRAGGSICTGAMNRTPSGSIPRNSSRLRAFHLPVLGSRWFRQKRTVSARRSSAITAAAYFSACRPARPSQASRIPGRASYPFSFANSDAVSLRLRPGKSNPLRMSAIGKQRAGILQSCETPGYRRFRDEVLQS